MVKKVKGWCIEVGKNLIDLYDKGYNRLIKLKDGNLS